MCSKSAATNPRNSQLVVIIMIIIMDLCSAFRSEDTEVLDW